MGDLELRRVIYETLARTGVAPTAAEVGDLVGDADLGAEQLRRLRDAHMLVLDEAGEILMALPFAARQTGHRVVADDGAWWANCAWDALAIPVALGVDAAIDATWLDTGEAVDLEVRDGQLRGGVRRGELGFVHFAIPARHWWDDIVET
jgi:hypothetical protein